MCHIIKRVYCNFILVIISMVVVVVAAAVVIGIVKIAAEIVMIGGMEVVGVDTVVEDPQRYLMNPHSLHLLVDYLMALYKEISIESLKI